MYIILFFFVAHWYLSLATQTLFLHRYAAHGYYQLSPFMERVAYLLTWLTQGSSYLSPDIYGKLHLAHHAFSDTEKDPHSPHHTSGPVQMMWETACHYTDTENNRNDIAKRFKSFVTPWDSFDNFAGSYYTRIAFGFLYLLFYLEFAPHWGWFLLLPVHFIMGPLHGFIVNWCGHKYGYRNFSNEDGSKNTLPVELFLMGELFQNNHHACAQRSNFAVRSWEWDPGHALLKVMNKLGWIKMKTRTQEFNEQSPFESSSFGASESV